MEYKKTGKLTKKNEKIYEIVEDFLKTEENNRQPIEFVINEKTGCWNVTNRFVDNQGYSFIRRKEILFNGRKLHRYIYTIAKGEIPEGLIIRHMCDNPSCLNPDHLEVGTHQDNVNDKKERGRSVNVVGIDHGNSVLTEKQVIEIYESTKSNSSLSRKYGISDNSIGRIKQDNAWTHITSGLKKGVYVRESVKPLKSRNSLTDKDHKYIKESSLSQRKLAEMFGVSKGCIQWIKKE